MDEIKENAPSFAKAFFRGLGGIGAGATGTIILGIILFLTWSIVGDTLAPKEVEQTTFGIDLNESKAHPLFLSITILAVFLSSLIANLFYCVINSFLEEKYAYARATSLTHTFFGNLTILLIFIPIYFICSKVYGTEGVALAAITNITIGGLFTFLVLESLSTKKHMLVSIYGVITGLSIFIFFCTLLAGGTATIISFIAMPLLLGSLGFGGGAAAVFYSWIEDSYGNDFLNTEKRFGNDYQNAESEQRTDTTYADEDPDL